MSEAVLFQTRQKIQGVRSQVLAVKMVFHHQLITIYGATPVGAGEYKYIFVDTLGNPQTMDAVAFEALYEPVVPIEAGGNDNQEEGKS